MVWSRACLVGMLAACYAPRPPTGVPCTPTAAECPASQSCQPVGDHFACVDGSGSGNPGPDAFVATDGDVDAATLPTDSTLPPDGPILMAGWTLIQTKSATSSTGVITISPTGSGHLIVVAIESSDAAATTAVTDDKGNTYTAVPNARSIDNTNGVGLDLWYATSSIANAQKIAATATSISAMVVWEVANIRATNPIDVTGIRDNHAATTAVRIGVTTTAAGDFVVAAAIVANQITGLAMGNEFTNDSLADANGWAHLTDPAAPAALHAAQWDQPTAGTFCASAVGFFVGP